MELIKLTTNDITPELQNLEALRTTLQTTADSASQISVKGNLQGDEAGAKDCTEKRLELRRNRLYIEDKEEQLLAPIKDLQKQIKETCKSLVSIIEPQEKRLKIEVENYEFAKKEAERKAELERKEKNRERFYALQKLGSFVTLQMVEQMDDDVYDMMLEQAKVIFDIGEAKRKEEAEKARVIFDIGEAKRKEEAEKARAEFESKPTPKENLVKPTEIVKPSFVTYFEITSDRRNVTFTNDHEVSGFILGLMNGESCTITKVVK